MKQRRILSDDQKREVVSDYINGGHLKEITNKLKAE